MYWGTHFWGMHAFWWIFWMVVVVSLLFWAWPGERRAEADSALDELRRRYAAGEIDDDEYRHRRDILTKEGGPAAPANIRGARAKAVGHTHSAA